MTSEPVLDPDLEQVLVDLAADPRSQLFITDPRKLLTGIQDGSIETPASRTGLRPAERHLLEVYRHELAYLLRQIYLDLLRTRAVPTVHPFVASRSSELARLIDQILAVPVPDQRYLPTRKQLAAYSCTRTVPNTMALIQASLSLHPSFVVQLDLANEYLFTNQNRSALSLCYRLLETHAEQALHFACWERIGASQDNPTHPGHSMAAYKRAFLLTQHRSTALAVLSAINLLRLAIYAGHRPQAEYAVSWLDDNMESSNWILQANLAAIKTYPDHFPSSELHTILLEASGSTATEVLNALST